MIAPRIDSEFACTVLFDEQGKILLLERAHTGWLDGLWGFPGGRIEQGETSAQAAAREAFEEVGLIVHESDLTLIHTLLIKHQGIHRGYFFSAKKWSGVPSLCEPHKSSGVSWFARETLPHTIIDSARHVIECSGACAPDLLFE